MMPIPSDVMSRNITHITIYADPDIIDHSESQSTVAYGNCTVQIRYEDDSAAARRNRGNANNWNLVDNSSVSSFLYNRFNYRPITPQIRIYSYCNCEELPEKEVMNQQLSQNWETGVPERRKLKRSDLLKLYRIGVKYFGRSYMMKIMKRLSDYGKFLNLQRN
ncbi:MAG: hypothetical protein MHMPM18_001940 [Marteilia pararefringens]